MSSCVESDNGRSSNYDRSCVSYNIGTGNRDDVQEELWHACAGPLANVPKVGETVFYFPQGHIEQVEAYTNQDDDMEMPIYELPSKILCKVVGVQLKVETRTDEVFAQVNLLPVTKQDEVNSNCKTSPMPRRDNPRFFVKILTRSDTSTHGGCSLPKQPAEECLPSLDKSQDPPEQDLIIKDLHGNEWCFRHIFRGEPKRHLLARGWSEFLTTKNLETGDACIFLRGRDGDMYIGVRRSMRPLSATSSPLLSANGMRHGILANANHAVSTGNMFTVYYRPWGCTSGFIIAYEQYMKAMANDCFIGKRLRMQFEDNKCGEQRLGGTVVGIKDIDPIQWPHSDWRCIEVQWDPTRAKCVRPERVSPWDIELVDPDRKKQAVVPTKRRRPHNLPSHWRSTFIMDGSHWTSVAPKSRRYLGVFQGQEKSDLANYKSNAQWTLPIVPCLPTPNQNVLASQGQIHLGVHSACHQHPESAFLVGDGGKGENQGRSDHWPPACIALGCDPVESLSAREISPANSACQAQKTSKTKDDNEKTAARTNRFGKCKVFGVSLADDTLDLPSPQKANSSELSGPSSVPPLSKSSNFAQIVINGAPLGRPTYLGQFKGCNDLIHGLDHRFNFGGTLIDGSNGWDVKCLDGHGDNVPIWDCTWQGIAYAGNFSLRYIKYSFAQRKKKKANKDHAHLM